MSTSTRPSERWTVADIEQLCVLAEEGMTISMIAARLNRTQGAVRARGALLGLTISSPSRYAGP